MRVVLLLMPLLPRQPQLKTSLKLLYCKTRENTSGQFNSIRQRSSQLCTPASLLPRLVQSLSSTKKSENPSVPKKPWILLSLTVHALAAWDRHGTEYAAGLNRKYPGNFPGGNFEQDPLARPFTRLPAPAYYASGFAMATGMNWMSLRMSRSPRLRRIWWLLQALTIIGNAQGVRSYYLENDSPPLSPRPTGGRAAIL